jgi:hypothetical protein
VLETWVFETYEVVGRSPGRFKREISIVLKLVDDYLYQVSIEERVGHPLTGEGVKNTVKCEAGGFLGDLCVDAALDLAEKILHEKGADTVKRRVESEEIY